MLIRNLNNWRENLVYLYLPSTVTSTGYKTKPDQESATLNESENYV